MTHAFKAYLQLILADMIAVLALAGCDNGDTYKDNVVPQELKVTTMSDSTHMFVPSTDSIVGCNFELGAVVDFPTCGAQPLDRLHQTIRVYGIISHFRRRR